MPRKTRPRFGILAGVLFAVAILYGCVSKPVVTLHHADLQYASLEGIGLVGIERNDYTVDEEGTLPRQMLVKFSSARIEFR